MILKNMLVTFAALHIATLVSSVTCTTYETQLIQGVTDIDRKWMKAPSSFVILDGHCSGRMTAHDDYAPNCPNIEALMVVVEDFQPYPDITIFKDLSAVTIYRSKNSNTMSCVGNAIIKAFYYCRMVSRSDEVLPGFAA